MIALCRLSDSRPAPAQLFYFVLGLGHADHAQDSGYAMKVRMGKAMKGQMRHERRGGASLHRVIEPPMNKSLGLG